MTWYLWPAMTRQIAPKPGAAKMRGEWAICEALREIGCQAEAPERIEFKRQGKRRHADMVESVLWPGYVIAHVPAHLFFEAVRVKGLIGAGMAIHPSEYDRSVLPMLTAAKAKAAEARRIAEAKDRAAMCQFDFGDPLELLSEQFVGQVLTFTRMVQRASDPYPMIEWEADMMGRSVKGYADPLDVRRAKA